jgi:hypothetical protein
MATILRAGCQLLKDTNGKSLVCSANPTVASVVYFMGCSTAQADGTFGKIDFTGAGANMLCYVWSNSQLASSGDVFPITGKQLPNSAMNLLASTTATNYTPTDTSVKGHLDGINTSLGLKANQSTTYTKTETDAKISATIASLDVMIFKGVINASANPNYPAGDAGHTYRISVAGKIGGASGINVEIGDILICLADGTLSGNQATVGLNWNISQANIDGAVISNETTTIDNDFIVFSGTTGKIIKKITLANYKTLLSLVKGDVGLENVDNTSDLNKPVSTATQTALNLKQNIERRTKVFANQTTNFTISQSDIDNFEAFEFTQTTAGIIITLSTPTGSIKKDIYFKNIGTSSINLVDINSPIAITKMSIASFNGTNWNIVTGGGGLITNNSITNDWYEGHLGI